MVSEHPVGSIAAQIGRLAYAIGTYETAWRASLGATGEDRIDASNRMQDAWRMREDAIANIATKLGPDLTRQIAAGMIAATVRVHGERPSSHAINQTVEAASTMVMRHYDYI